MYSRFCGSFGPIESLASSFDSLYFVFCVAADILINNGEHLGQAL